MTTFRPCILKCPQCKSNMSSYELTSYTVHNSVVYSDGKVISSSSGMLDHLILICSECYAAFWKDDAVLEDDNLNNSYGELPEAKDFHDLPFAFDSDYSSKLAIYFSELLEKGFANTVKREVYLRIKLWHLLNNSKRNDAGKFYSKLFKKNKEPEFKRGELSREADNLFKANLNRLIDIYKPENDDELLMLAEMYRELGNFSQALLLLDEVENISNNNAYKKIKLASKRKQSRVIKLN